MKGAIKRFLLSHPVLIVAYPVDLGIGIAFMLSISTDAGAVIQAAFCGLIVLIVSVKLSLAAERSGIGNFLCGVAVLLNAFAATSFFVTHAAPHAVVRETVQIGALRDKVEEWDTLLKNGRQDIKDALAINRRTVVDTILTPQLNKDQVSRDEAQERLDGAIQVELAHTPDAIEVFERPFRLLAEPSLGRIALLVFAIGASLFLEGVMWRSMRGKTVRVGKTDGSVNQPVVEVPPELTVSPTYPRNDDGSLVPPAKAAVTMNVSFDVALALYSEERKKENG